MKLFTSYLKLNFFSIAFSFMLALVPQMSWSNTYVGNAILNDALDVLAFEAGAYTVVTGNLHVLSTGITNTSAFSTLTSVGGNLYFYNNDNLTDLSGLSNLTNVGGGVNLRINDAITNLDGLDNLSSIGDYLTIWRNNNLTDISALSSLTTIPGFLQFNGTQLTTLDGLHNISTIGGNLMFDGNSQLIDFAGLSALESVGGNFFIGKNIIGTHTDLVSLDGLEKLNEVNGNFSIIDNPALSDCCAIAAFLDLGVIGGTISFSGNVAGCNSAIDIISNCSDSDGDGVLDEDDNCPEVSNPGQEDANGNGVGDACDVCDVTRLYVNRIASGDNNGTSWPNAFTELKEALEFAATCGEIEEIWIAQGTYKPDFCITCDAADRNNSFDFSSVERVYGGFSGTGNPGMSDRDWEAYPTILSGDIGSTNYVLDNSYSVVYIGGIKFEKMDGLYIRNGRAYGSGFDRTSSGGGVYCANRDCPMENCMVTDNFALRNGGGIYYGNGAPDLFNCSFDNNSASEDGGALYIADDYTSEIANCSFRNNNANENGGAISHNNDTKVKIYNSEFYSNFGAKGGAFYFRSFNEFPSGDNEMINCTFAGNLGLTNGNIIYVEDVEVPLSIKNSILWDDDSVTGFYPLFWTGAGDVSNPFILRNILTDETTCTNLGGSASCLSGMNYDAADPFTDFSAGNLELATDSEAIDAGGNAAITATGLTTDLLGNPRIVNSTVDLGAYEASEGGPSGDCSSIAISTEDDEIFINGLDATPVSKVQIFDTDWSVIYTCFGDCNAIEAVSAPAGDYLVRVSLHDSGWNVICEVEEDVTVTGKGGGGTGSGDCDDLEIMSSDDEILISGLDATPISKVQIFDNDWNVVFDCFGDCGATENVAVANGNYLVRVSLHNSSWQWICQEELSVNVTAGGGSEVCDISHSVDGDQLTLTGVGSPFAIIDVYDASWNNVFHCGGSDCNSPQVINGLSPEEHYVSIRLYDASWSKLCEETFYVTMTPVASFLKQTPQPYLFFQAHKDQRAVRLDWTTNSDYKIEEFIIERSTNGSEYEVIGMTNSLFHDNAAHTYQWMDEAPVEGENVYRIQEVYDAGPVQYSEEQPIYFDIDLGTIAVFPNPTTDFISINLNEQSSFVEELKISNQLGRTMVTIKGSRLPDSPIKMDVRDYPAGIYFMTIQTRNQKIQTQRFVVKRL